MNRKDFEETLILIKPDALKNSMTGYILSQLSETHTGSRFSGAKIVHVSTMLAEEHYAEHRGKPFFHALIDYLTGVAHYPNEAWKRRVIALVFHGPGIIKKIRRIVGPTNPHVARETNPGSIRSMGTVVPILDKEGRIISERMDNLIHASASKEEAEREIKLWFKPNEIPPAMQLYKTQICEEHYYYAHRHIFCRHEAGSVCLLAPGDLAWKSDLEILKQIIRKRERSPHTIATVAAKYLINVSMTE
jgi:nucleoside-diphosphate kinase